MRVEDVRVTLAPARPELVFNQLTGGSNTIDSMFTPIRVAAAVARGALLQAAATALGATVASLVVKNGIVTAPDGGSRTYGELAGPAASSTTTAVDVELAPKASSFDIVGTPRSRVDALEAVTGRKRLHDRPRRSRRTADDGVPGADAQRHARQRRNRATVQAMPGVTDVVVVDTGVAVRAETFGQCIDAVRALRGDVGRRPGRGRVRRHPS